MFAALINYSMEVSEVRIGNKCLSPDGNVFNVLDIIHCEDGYRVREFGVSVENAYKIESISGVPLTDEWLIKFNFEKINHIHGYSFWSLKRKKNGGQPDISIYDLKTLVNGHSVILVKYVDQLQNLYFGLTGEELSFL